MSVEFRITRGARAGATERFEKSVVSIGRHPMNDLRFDTTKDIDVSGRHAELRSAAGKHVLHDIGSTNGTFVNGERIVAEREIRDGDVVLFGANGPQATFHVMLAEAAKDPPVTRGPQPQGAAPAARAPAAAPPISALAPASAPRMNTEVRIAHAVQQQTGKLKQIVLALAAFVVVGGSAVAYVSVRGNAEARKQVTALLAMNDSLARSLEQRLAQTGVAAEALGAARAETARLANELRARQESGGDVSTLSARMRTAKARTASIAGTDYPAIAAANKAAIVFVVVLMPDGSKSSGTGFNILPSGLVVTNRHVVQAADGTRAQTVGVIFEGRRGEWHQARVEYVSTTDELALLRINDPGQYPIVTGIAGGSEGVQMGSPIAILGFPLGTGTAGNDGDINTLRPVATMNVGTVSKTLADNIQLDVFAAQGSSGSPVLDGRGLVIGVLYGAVRESNGRIVYSVPSARLAAQLPPDAAGVIR